MRNVENRRDGENMKQGGLLYVSWRDRKRKRRRYGYMIWEWEEFELGASWCIPSPMAIKFWQAGWCGGRQAGRQLGAGREGGRRRMPFRVMSWA